MKQERLGLKGLCKRHGKFSMHLSKSIGKGKIRRIKHIRKPKSRTKDKSRQVTKGPFLNT